MGRGRYRPKAKDQCSTALCIWIHTQTQLFVAQQHRHSFYWQGMWRRAIQWRIQDHKGSSKSSGSHSIRQSLYRGDHDLNPQQRNMYGWNHGSHPGELQPTSCVWDYSPRWPFCRIPNFHSNRGPWLYVSVVFQMDYTWSHHKNPHIKIATDIPTCYLLVGAWVGSTEFSLLQDLAYCGGGYIKEHWSSYDRRRIPWTHQHRQWQLFIAPNLWHRCHYKLNDRQCQNCFDTIKECIWNKSDSTRCAKVQDISVEGTSFNRVAWRTEWVVVDRSRTSKRDTHQNNTKTHLLSCNSPSEAIQGGQSVP